MPNRNHNDKARANFNARHNCSEKKDKTKVIPTTQLHEHIVTLYMLTVSVRSLSTGWLLGV